MELERAPEGAEGFETSELDEFAELLGAIGAEAPGEAEDGTDLAQATIQALRETLSQLEPLGLELADTERRRLELDRRVRDLEGERDFRESEQRRLLRENEVLARRLAEAQADLADFRQRLELAGRAIHQVADRTSPVPRKEVRRLANLMAVARDEAQAITAELRSLLDPAC
jgi:chromosome segregation ATPase